MKNNRIITYGPIKEWKIIFWEILSKFWQGIVWVFEMIIIPIIKFLAIRADNAFEWCAKIILKKIARWFLSPILFVIAIIVAYIIIKTYFF